MLNLREVWQLVPEKSLTITMFVTFFVLTAALYSVEPVITVYITQLSHNSSHIALISGLTFSASGLANIIAAPRLGKLSDTIVGRIFFAKVDKFLEAAGQRTTDVKTLEISKESLSRYAGVVTMQYE